MAAHHRTLILVTAAVIAVIGGNLAVKAYGRSPYTVLTRGEFQGIGWRLWAWEQHGELCMLILSDGADPGRVDLGEGGGQCGFNDDPTSGNYFVGGTIGGPGGAMAEFGPLPEKAVTVRISGSETVATAELPGGRGLPKGRYWFRLIPQELQTEDQHPEPLDAVGNPVAFQSF